MCLLPFEEYILFLTLDLLVSEKEKYKNLLAAAYNLKSQFFYSGKEGIWNYFLPFLEFYLKNSQAENVTRPWQANRKGYLGDNLHPRCKYALSVPVAASKRPRYGGEGFIGLEENSGWNWTPTKYGWSKSRKLKRKWEKLRKRTVFNETKL